MKNRLFGRMGEMLKDNALICALVVAVCRAAFFSYRTISNINHKLENKRIERVRETPVPDEGEKVQDVQEEQKNVPLNPATPRPDKGQNSEDKEDPRETPDETPDGEGDTEQTSAFTFPVEGKIFSAFSGDELVYNRTLDDWRTHNGVDISASKDEPVRAGADGTVKSVYTDGLLGTVIEINHGEFVAKYCGLSADVYVKEGDNVTRGQNLGTVGEVDMEVSEQPHLHLEIITGGKAVNPDTVLG